MLSHEVENLIIRFLEMNCYGDFKHITGYQSRFYLNSIEHQKSDSFIMDEVKMEQELIIRCKFKTSGNFPGYTKLGDKLFNTLRPAFKGINKITIESYHPD